jgi:hypothetical protein
VGRGSLFSDALDGPQLGAILMVLLGALLLLERTARHTNSEAGHA